MSENEDRAGGLPARLGGALRSGWRPLSLVSGGLLLGVSATLLVSGSGGVPALPRQTTAAQVDIGPPGAGFLPLTASPRSDPARSTPARVSSVVRPRPRAAQPAHLQPVQLLIPAIRVKSSLVGLGLNPDGSLEVPTDTARAGWFLRGPAPGDSGGPPAVIVGHIDSRTGPAVFYRLRELHAGSAVLVHRIDGSTLRFRVYRVASYPKSGFPDAQVYGVSPRSELRLITCTGAFDRTRKGYQDNLVAYASLVGRA